MDSKLLFDESVPPVVWALDKPEELVESIGKIRELLVKEPGRYRTIVIDSGTHFLDMYLTKVENDLAATNMAKEPRNAYRELWKRYGFDIGVLHSVCTNHGVNVIHLALDKEPTQESPGGGPLLIGQAAKKVPSMCEYVLYFRYWRDNPQTPHKWEIRSRSFERHGARGRDEGKLPDPLPSGGYRAMAEVMGWPLK